MCPKWIPKGYSIALIDVKKTNQANKASAVYSSDQNELIVRVSTAYSEDGLSSIEADESEYQVFEFNGDLFYISFNFDVLQSFGMVGNYKYSIIGTMNKKEMEIIIQSLYR